MGNGKSSPATFLGSTLGRRRLLDSGDVLLFSTKSLFGHVIRWVTDSPWSHVGIVIRRGDQRFVLEATPDRTIPCVTCEKMHGGVRLVPLAERLKLPGRVDCRQLVGVDRSTRETLVKLSGAEQFDEKPYPGYFDPNFWLSAIDFDHPLFLADDDDQSYFCSKLVIRVYKDAKLLDWDDKSRASEFTPRSFSEEVDKVPLKGKRPDEPRGPRLGEQFTLRR